MDQTIYLVYIVETRGYRYFLQSPTLFGMDIISYKKYNLSFIHLHVIRHNMSNI